MLMSSCSYGDIMLFLMDTDDVLGMSFWCPCAVIIWLCYSYGVRLLLRWCHSVVIMMLWCCCSDVLVMALCCCLWRPYVVLMMSLRCSYDVKRLFWIPWVVFLWCAYHVMLLPLWCSYDVLMMSLQSTYDVFTMFCWCSDGFNLMFFLDDIHTMSFRCSIIDLMMHLWCD